MTPKQIELARHALGLRKGQPISYRNCFVTGVGCVEHEPWLAMVAKGLAVKRTMPMFGGDDLFHLTLEGAEQALLPGESLGDQRFPQPNPTPKR